MLCPCAVLTALGRGAVEGVLCSVAVDHLVGTVISLDWEGHLKHVVAGFHDGQDAFRHVAFLLQSHSFLHLLYQLILHYLYDKRYKNKGVYFLFVYHAPELLLILNRLSLILLKVILAT